MRPPKKVGAITGCPDGVIPRRRATDGSSGSRPAVVPRMLGIPEAAVYIGGTNWFTEELIRSNEVLAIAIGKGRKIDVRDLNAWIEAEKQKQVIDPPAPIGFARGSRRLRTAA